MPKQRKLSGAGVVLLNDFQAKAEFYGGTTHEPERQEAKDEMLKARYRLERYMILMNGYAGKFISLREEAKRRLKNKPNTGHKHTDQCDPTNCDISSAEWLARHSQPKKKGGRRAVRDV